MILYNKDPLITDTPGGLFSTFFNLVQTSADADYQREAIVSFKSELGRQLIIISASTP